MKRNVRKVEFLGGSPLLKSWEETKLYEGIPSLEIDQVPADFEHLRLGHIVEEFFYSHLKERYPDCKIEKGIQISGEGRTLGELDFIIDKGDVLLHIELAFKFYLLDASKKPSEIESWIGPNRKDSLEQKLSKLKKQQFNLIHKVEAQEILRSKFPNFKRVEQCLALFGRCFNHFSLASSDGGAVLKEAIKGHWFRRDEFIKNFENDIEFYLPKKKEWLITDYSNIDWMNLKEVEVFLDQELFKGNSPMLWVKRGEDVLQSFVVWWKE